MKTENKCNETVGVKRIRQDEWSRECVQNVWTNEIYIDVDGVWHTSTSEGEPNYPISKDIIFNMKMTTRKIKEYISNQSNFNLITSPKIWKFFKKSDYLAYILEENHLDNVNHYCDEFMMKCRNLNLF